MAIWPALLAAPLYAQGVRISGTTTVDYVDVQPLVLDSVLASSTSDSGLLRRTADGIIVECVGADPYCRYYRSATRVSTGPVLQDLELSGWGLGTGISIYAQGRVRTSIGNASEIWPFAGDHFDLLAAYAELQRTRWRVRLGRQWYASPLGYYAYDGGSVRASPLPGLSGELYGGWGLAQGWIGTRTSSAISAVEDLPPDDRGYILGAAIQYRPTLRGGVSVQYQREIRTDRAALYSERMAAAADLLLGGTRIDARAVYDIATGDFNDARLRAQRSLGRRWIVSGEVRHYLPFFELWTIWGAFSPVGYNEGLLTATWSTSDERIRIDGSASYRRYAETNAGLGFLPLRNDGWTVGAQGSWRVAPAWTALGGYHIGVGYGASRSDFDAGVRWQRRERVWLGVNGSAFQTIEEFSVGEGRVLGLAVDGGVRLSADTRVAADIALYHHTQRGAPQLANWNQRRASIRLQWTIGGDPGLAERGGRR
ncbi:MAG TPA: hypothetical protein VFR95_07425 [Gemmatimonadaceae bacterium]|nr:hypothetical protein [Gemmatimonadaceae bacterium]